LALAGALALTACGDDDGDGASDETTTSAAGATTTAAAGGTTYTVTGVAFTDFTAKAGETVAVKNNGPSHTMTADDGAFNVALEGGTTSTLTAPAAAGEYPFHCNIHPSMEATLTVEA
jgi:plastocyanin